MKGQERNEGEGKERIGRKERKGKERNEREEKE